MNMELQNYSNFNLKKMDTSSIAIGVILMLLFVGPIVYLIIKQNSKDKTKLKNLKSLSAQNQMDLDEIELTNGLMLGLDSKSKKLLVVEPNNNMQYDVIDLNKVNLSHVSKKGQPKVNGKKDELAVTHISLELLKNKPREIVTEIVFYDEEDNSSYNAETQMSLANKWDRLIRANISA